MKTSKMEALPNGYKYSLKEKKWYANIIGLLMYVMLKTCINITYSILFLNRFLKNPGPQHIHATKRIMQYFWRTTKLELTFCELLVRYTNSDWVGDLETCRLTSGYLFNIGSGVIGWSSKKQSTISLSSYEAKYIMQTQTTKKKSGYNQSSSS